MDQFLGVCVVRCPWLANIRIMRPDCTSLVRPYVQHKMFSLQGRVSYRRSLACWPGLVAAVNPSFPVALFSLLQMKKEGFLFC